MNKTILIIAIIIIAVFGIWWALSGVDFSEPIYDVTPPDDEQVLPPDEMDNGEEQLFPAVSEVFNHVADTMGVELDSIELISAEPNDWPDACLGLPEEDEMCAMVITPGYEVVVAVEGENYQYRTNIDGTVIRADI